MKTLEPKQNNTNHRKGAGFTLVEIIVAIFLMTMGAGGAFAVIQLTTALTPLLGAQLTASYLAQEGIEIVRNTRDTNWLTGNNWNLNLPDGTETNILGKFNRTVAITEDIPDEKITVSVEVSWSERGRHHRATAQTELYNWLER